MKLRHKRKLHNRVKHYSSLRRTLAQSFRQAAVITKGLPIDIKFKYDVEHRAKIKAILVKMFTAQLRVK